MFHQLANAENFHFLEGFTNPFCYDPHPAVIAASLQIEQFLARDSELQKSALEGKMFGVLIVQNNSKEIGFLAAFSGLIGARNMIDGFVPPIYDLLDEQGVYLLGEREISALNNQINELGNSEEIHKKREELATQKKSFEEQIKRLQEQMRTDRERRTKIREEGCTAEILEELIKESQRQKSQLAQFKREQRPQIEQLEATLQSHLDSTSKLKQLRKTKSAALQRKLFDAYKVNNAKGEQTSLTQIFENYNGALPPAGSGECAAPKLMQYAYSHDLKPLAMGEFWVGQSPRQQIRHEGHFYAACRSRCYPILSYMLQGLECEVGFEPPQSVDREANIIFEDDHIIAYDKPSGLLSVRGKSDRPSIESIAQAHCPTALMVHRLDMDTSGVILVAKSEGAHKSLQFQFTRHTIRKTYIALLDGVTTLTQDRIELPLAPDIEDRPRQKVDHDHGKSAITDFRVLSTEGNTTRIELQPLTGRTHQLRVHMAHAEGVGIPILGDRLYSRTTPATNLRLHLHAQSIYFDHPATGERTQITAPQPF